jgi:hypothetical protein
MLLSEIQLCDPFVLPFPEERCYYLFGSTDEDIWTDPGIGFDCYRSTDLREWSGPIPAFRPPAGFAANDQMALGVLRALQQCDRRVPQDVLVAGFDDMPEAAFLLPPLTTVRQNLMRLAGRRSRAWSRASWIMTSSRRPSWCRQSW